MEVLSVNTPRYRYYEEAPANLSVPLAELLDRIPTEHLQDLSRGEPGSSTQDSIELPCKELLAGNTPGLLLGKLSDLLPGKIVMTNEADRMRKVELPAGWLVLHYRLVTRSEEMESVGEQAKGARVPEDGNRGITGEERIIDAALVTTPIAKPPSSSLDEKSVSGLRGEPEEKATAQVQAPEETLSKESPHAGADLSEEQEPKPLGEVNKGPNKGLFASLPIFSRQKPDKVSRESAVCSEIPEIVMGEKAVPLVVRSSENEGKESPSLLALEPLWKLDPGDQLADPTHLQDLFMTEEKLTLDRVIALAGQLPGLRACVLAHGDQVVCASNTSAGVDLQTLSGQAMTMLSQIRESSAKMGLGSIPAVTLHAEQGALSFLHKGELCLLVLHADRGFIPGVRERLQEMLGHLSDAKALPPKGSAEEAA